MHERPYRGRIAPSPTGLLHLGHAKTFWTAFQRSLNAGGTLIHRNEDIDPLRCKPEYARAGIEDLTRLGIRWQEGPYNQSERIGLYRNALECLIQAGHVYPCVHSRKTISQTGRNGKSPSGEILFNPSLRPAPTRYQPPPILSVNWRFLVPDHRVISFTDLKRGPQSFRSQSDFGDFLVWRKEGVPSYELAVVVDDIAMKITEVVRGADLLVSTARQWLLYEAFGAPVPGFYHEDLVLDASGERLAKTKASMALRTLFVQGHDIESIQALWQTTPAGTRRGPRTNPRA